MSAGARAILKREAGAGVMMPAPIGCPAARPAQDRPLFANPIMRVWRGEHGEAPATSASR